MSAFHPLVSIVIPVYNGANYMREAIDSALAQTYDNIEIIVVNDGSTDAGQTEAIALSYGDAIRYFHKPNGGVATALNVGIKNMHGEYFSWLSHDDRYLPEKIASQVEFIQRFELYDAAVFSDFYTIDASGKRIACVISPAVNPDTIFQCMYIDPFLHGCAMLIPKKPLVDLGAFPEQYITTQDYELWLTLCRKIPFVYHADILIESRVHQEQGSRTISVHSNEVLDLHKRHFQEFIKALEKDNCQNAVGKGMSEAFAERIQSRWWRSAWYIFAYILRTPSLVPSCTIELSKIFFKKVCRKIKRSTTPIVS